jgi:hypothetical protein
MRLYLLPLPVQLCRKSISLKYRPAAVVGARLRTLLGSGSDFATSFNNRMVHNRTTMRSGFEELGGLLKVWRRVGIFPAHIPYRVPHTATWTVFFCMRPTHGDIRICCSKWPMATCGARVSRRKLQP